MSKSNSSITYEKPSIITWTAAELDGIEASMSGGGGGGGFGGGVVVPPVSGKHNSTPVSNSVEFFAYVSGYYYPNIDSGRVYFEGHRKCYLSVGMQVSWSDPVWANGKYNYYFTVVAACEGMVIRQANDVTASFADIVRNLFIEVDCSASEAVINENSVEFFASPPLPDDLSSNDISALNCKGYALDGVLSLLILPESTMGAAAVAFGGFMLSNYGYTLGQLLTRGWFLTFPDRIEYSPPWRMHSRYPYVSAGLTFEVSAPAGCAFTLNFSTFSTGDGDNVAQVDKTIVMNGWGQVASQ